MSNGSLGNKDKDIEDLDYEFCDLFFSKDFADKNIVDKLKTNISLHIEMQEEHVSYSNIAKYIFYKCDEKKMGESILDRCAQCDVLETQNNMKFIKKTVEDIKLACAQKEYINKSIKSLKGKIEGSEKKIDKFKTNLDKIYAEFVTLLGIFTAIAFSIFGGLQALSSLFSKLEFSKPKITMGFVLIIGSIISTVIYGIIIVLMDSIYKFTNTYNNQEGKNYPISKNLNIWILIVLCLMFAVGFICL